MNLDRRRQDAYVVAKLVDRVSSDVRKYEMARTQRTWDGVLLLTPILFWRSLGRHWPKLRPLVTTLWIGTGGFYYWTFESRLTRTKGLETVQRNLSVLQTYQQSIQEPNRRAKFEEAYQSCYKTLAQDPLYRNIEEQESAFKAFSDGVDLLNEAYSIVDFTECIREWDVFCKRYLLPIIEQVSDVKYSQEDLLKLFGWEVEDSNGQKRTAQIDTKKDVQRNLKRGTTRETKNEKEPEWTLGVPSRDDEFWEWMKDPKTGKPKRKVDGDGKVQK